MPILFLLGILAIALEDVIKVNKAATAVGMCVILWFLFLADATQLYQLHKPGGLEEYIKAFPSFAELSLTAQAYKYISFTLIDALGDVSTTLFFVLASMTIIDVIDGHGGFSLITNSIKTNKKRKLLWIISFISFIMAAIIDDLAAVIVMVAMARKLVPSTEERLIYSCMIIIAANAGGSWSPIGDVTTLILWTGGNITVMSQIYHVFLPGLVMMLIPLFITTLMIPKQSTVDPLQLTPDEVALNAKIDPKLRKATLIIGMASLALVPLFQSIFELPPFMGVLFGMVILWVITDRKYSKTNDKELRNLRVSKTFSKVDVSTIFFFLGILMSVQALKAAGQLSIMSDFLNSYVSSSTMKALIFGLCSSFLDNVALVSAAMGMYPLQTAGEFMVNGDFWLFLAYCAVTGGSILIIGSASGVAVMGLEKISFGYYLKKFTPMVFLSYLAGAGVFWLLFLS